MSASVAFALGAALFFGLALVLTQNGLRYIAPLEGSCISITTAAVLFVALAPVTVDLAGWDTGSAALFALIGCLFPAAVTILTFAANRRIGAEMTGALGNLAPLFAVVFAIVILGEALGVGQAAGIAAIVGGVVMLFRTKGSGQSGAAWTMWLPMAAAALRGAVQPAVKIGLAAWPDPFAAVTIGYIVSSAVVLAVGAVRRRGWPVPYDRRGWLWFAAVGACNGLAVLCMYQALALGPVTLVAPLVACYPLATIALRRLMPGAPGLGGRAMLGVALTVAGVAVLLVA